MIVQVESIDHVHIEVRDRSTSAAWYHRILGFVIAEKFAEWADDPMGPPILATAHGQPVLSLFARDYKAVSRDATVAFRVSGEQFINFVSNLTDLGLLHVSGRQLTLANVVDHNLSWSIYFLDLDENRIELTTYDHMQVKTAL